MVGKFGELTAKNEKYIIIIMNQIGSKFVMYNYK